MKMGDSNAKSTILWLFCRRMISNWIIIIIIISSGSSSSSSSSSAGPSGRAV